MSIRRVSGSALRLFLTTAILGAIVAGASGLIEANIAHGQGADPDVVINQIDPAQFPLLTVYATVNDSSGVPMGGIESGAFAIREDGVAIPLDEVQVSTVGEERTPIQLALAFDISQSMADAGAMEPAKAAARDFVDQLSPGDRVAIFAFNEEVTQVIDFTDNKDVLKDRIGRLEASGGTALYEVIRQAAEAVKPREGRRGFIVLTDGWNDTRLATTLDEAARAANDAQAPGYVLGFGSAYDTALQRIADETGGIYLREPSATAVRDLFNRLTGLLQSQYIVKYRSQIDPPAGSHELVLEVTTASGSGRDTAIIVFPPGFSPTPPTASPTDTPTASNPTALPEVTSPVPTLASPPPHPPGACEDPASLFDLIRCNLWWLILATLFVLALLGAMLLRRPKREVIRCSRCGNVMEPEWTECLFCEQERERESGGGNGAESDDDPQVGLVDQPDTVIKKPSLLAWLTGIDGPFRGRELRLQTHDRAETTIGRSGNNVHVLADETVSRQHAKIRMEDGALMIQDLAASNPIEVDGKVVLKHTLEDGDRVKIGATTFVFKQVKLEA